MALFVLSVHLRDRNYYDTFDDLSDPGDYRLQIVRTVTGVKSDQRQIRCEIRGIF